MQYENLRIYHGSTVVYSTGEKVYKLREQLKRSCRCNCGSKTYLNLLILMVPGNRYARLFCSDNLSYMKMYPKFGEQDPLFYFNYFPYILNEDLEFLCAHR
jgi:hypothetical protein